jgi:alpha-D-ribose 1-methylphosphonate 5-triphosphate synthase subunit PhnI
MAFIDDLKTAQEQALAAITAEREEVNGKVTDLQTQLTEAQRLVTEGGTQEQQLAALAAAQNLVTEIQGIYTAPVVEPPVEPSGRVRR